LDIDSETKWKYTEREGGEGGEGGGCMGVSEWESGEWMRMIEFELREKVLRKALLREHRT
jgi:hypothetical protein